MKISKVDHNKTAVGNMDNMPIKGFIYKDPKRVENGTSVDINKRIKDARRTFESIYSVFDEKKFNKDTQDFNLVKQFNKDIRNVLKNSKGNIGFNELINGLNKFDSIKYEPDNIIYSGLKQSFQTEKIIKSIRILIRYVCENIKDINTDEKKLIENSFIGKIIKDYQKFDKCVHIPKAISNQNMVVQIDNDTRKLNLAKIPPHPESKHDDNSREREAFKRFLSGYSNLDDSVRHNIRVRLRRLVDLYFYGIEAVKLEDFNEWKDHEEKKARNDLFVDKQEITVKKESEGKKTEVDADLIKDTVRKKNIIRYRNTIKIASDNPTIFFDDQDVNVFWIHFIEKEVEKLFSKIKNNNDFVLKIGYVSEKVWKSMINYISIKYIALGKAVYHCALKDLDITDTSNLNIDLTKIDDKYLNGISSFHYELIKAEEDLQRDVSESVAFAANHLAHATISNINSKDDFLTLTYEDLKKKAYPNTMKNIMQFFGGYSKWKSFFEKNHSEDYDDIVFLRDIRNIIYSLRNSSFHFTTKKIDNDSWNTELIGNMFEKDCEIESTVLKNKLYFNNLPMYYADKPLENVLHRLYDSCHERASQVPSFNKVFIRKNFASILLKYNYNVVFNDDLDMLNWQSAIFYLFKEIYYNDFLQNDSSLSLFLRYVDDLKIEKDDRGKTTKSTRPNEDFKNAINFFKNDNTTLSSLCQQIMTEYNRQNDTGVKKRNYNVEKKHPKIFQHYRMILFDGLRHSFMRYVQENEKIFGFIKKPNKKSEGMSSVTEFLPNYFSRRYINLIETVKTNPELQKWYILGRLLNPRQVNLFIGDIRRYVQYINDILRRAKENGNNINNYIMPIDYKHIIEILEICTKLNGVVSNVVTDYFTDEDDYSSHIGKYIDFELENSAVTLRDFCNQIYKGKRIGIYYDGVNPIVNRNVVLCKLFGITDILDKNKKIKKVTKDVLYKYLDQQDKLVKYRKDGLCTNIAEQEFVNQYQWLKNRIELRDIVEYTEILNELHGQLIKWVYLRERDLMYFQLGFHYLCLNNNSPKPKEYVEINVGGVSLYGAILYQIISMYTNGMNLYYIYEGSDYISKMAVITGHRTGKKLRYHNIELNTYEINKIRDEKFNGTESIGSKIKYFLRYGDGIGHDKGYGEQLYYTGLEIFENLSEHDNIANLRKYIEHFRYFSQMDRSMLDIYSEVFDRFFSYDSKLRKNVINMMYNILLSHQVISKYQFGTSEKMIGTGEKSLKQQAACFMFKEKNGIDSDKFTYKYKQDGQNANKKTPQMLHARNTEFLMNVANLISYPKEVANDVVGCERENKKVRINNKVKNTAPVNN